MGDFVYLGVCGSLRKASRNMGILRKAAEIAPAGARVEIADISRVPFYNQDIAKPESVKRLVAAADACDGYILACPEYNYSLAPALKNALDWLSREPNLKPLAGKPGAIVGAGGGMGTCRSQMALRQVCVYLNLKLIDKPEFYSNAFSASYNAEGDLVDEGLIKNLSSLLEALLNWTKLLRAGAKSA